MNVGNVGIITGWAGRGVQHEAAKYHNDIKCAVIKSLPWLIVCFPLPAHFTENQIFCDLQSGKMTTKFFCQNNHDPRIIR